MKRLLICLLLVGVVGCGKKQSVNTNEGNDAPENSAKKEVKETPSKGDDKNSTTAKPVKELKINDVVGSYEKDSNQRFVFLDNGVAASYALLMDPREFLKDNVKDLEKRLVNSIKEFGEDNVTTKAFAEMLAEEKEKLAAAGSLDDPKNLHRMNMDYKWEIKDGEVHTVYLGIATVYRMEPNGDLTSVRNLTKKGSRIDIPKEKQKTLKKIK